MTAAPSTADAQLAQQEEPIEEMAFNITNLRIENVSTSMEAENGTIMVETEDGTQEIQIESATVELEEATVEVSNAEVRDGEFHLEEANVSVTEGQIDVETDQGSRNIDLSDTNETVENETVTLDGDLAEDLLGTSENLEDVTITEMTVEGISGEASHDLLVANFQAPAEDGVGTDETDNASVVLDSGDMTVENSTVTVTNATVEGDTMMVEQVEGSVESLEVNADRVILLRGVDLQERNDYSQTFEDEGFTASDVEVSAESLMDLLEALVSSQPVMSAQG